MVSFKQLVESIDEDLLIENRIQFLKDKTPELSTDHDEFAEHKDKDKIIDHLSDKADPTKNKIHTQWLVGQYKKGNIRQEDHPALHHTLSQFEKYKGKLEKKDINQYKTVGELRDAVNPHEGTAATKKEEAEQGRHEVHSEPGLKVYHLKSKQASQDIYGGGSSHGGNHTDWCTAARGNQNMYDNYAGTGDLYTFHKENDPRSPYQLHLHHKNISGQFQDRKDEHAELHKDILNHHPDVKNIPAFKNSKHIAFHDEDTIKNNVKKIEAKTGELSNEDSQYKHQGLQQIKDHDFLNDRLHDKSVHLNPNLTKEQQTHVLEKHGSESLRYNRGLHPDIIDKVGARLNDHDNITKHNLINHISKEKSKGSLYDYGAKEIASHPAADTEVVNHLHDSGDESVKRAILDSKHLSANRVDPHLEHPIKGGIAAKHPNLTDDQYKKLHKYATDNELHHINDHLSKNKSVPAEVHKNLISLYADHDKDIVKNSTKNLKGKK